MNPATQTPHQSRKVCSSMAVIFFVIRFLKEPYNAEELCIADDPIERGELDHGHASITTKLIPLLQAVLGRSQQRDPA